MRSLLHSKDSKLYIIATVLVLILFFLTRLVKLTIIPVFADEAIYIRWSQIMQSVASLRFLPLSDGKQPLFMWLTIPALKIFSDPLIAGRAISVISGFFGLAGIWLLSFILFKNKNVSLFAAILYLISPFILFFNRMALPDNLLMVFFIWVVALLALTSQTLRFDLAMLTGIGVGLAWLTKSPAIFLLILMPGGLLIFNYFGKGRSFALFRLLVYWVVISLFGLTIYSLLRLGPEFHMIAIRNRDYIYSFTEVLKHPLSPLIGNLKSVGNWFWIWITPLVFLLGIGGVCLALKKSLKTGLFLLLWTVIPLLAQSGFAKVYTARYVLFIVPYWLIFSAVAVERVFHLSLNKLVMIFILVLVFFIPLYQSLLLIINPARAWIPENEREGYLQMWTAGYGIKPSADYLKIIARDSKVLVGTEGYFGTLPDGLQIYLNQVPNLTVIGVGYPIKEVPKQLTDGLIDSRVFLLVNDSRFEVKDTGGLKLIASYPKATSRQGRTESLLFYEVLAR